MAEAVRTGRGARLGLTPFLRRVLGRIYAFRGVRDLAFATYIHLPSIVSVFAYRFARRYVVGDPREGHFKRVFDHLAVQGVDGDYLEFGVMWGRSLVMAAQQAERVGLGGMRFIGFDSFEGLPSGEGGIFDLGDYRSTQATAERYIRAAGVDMSRVQLIRGWFGNTLTDETARRLRLYRLALVYIDCDLYESTRDALRFVEPYLVNGSMILFDDWGAFDRVYGDSSSAYGQKRALQEWRCRDRCKHVDSHGEAAAFVFVSRD